ncbi:hypothetical protein [Phosphitispora sp. TUW77]|uniref:hypothetical protein n=1 Tax=Phosphitispora sp. TUW77 TaxID=3152361 RepID=UPI003AB1E4B0
MIKNVIQDFKVNSFRSGVILFFYRLISTIYYKFDNLLGKVLVRLINFIWEVLKMIMNINCQISYKAQIGSNIRLLHIGEGVIISAKAIIGNDVSIYHQVTIGINEFLPLNEQKIVIGNNCYISAGAKIISCVLGDNVKVGPNAVVYRNVNSNQRVFVQGMIK